MYLKIKTKKKNEKKKKRKKRIIFFFFYIDYDNDQKTVSNIDIEFKIASSQLN